MELKKMIGLVQVTTYFGDTFRHNMKRISILTTKKMKK